MSLNAVYFNAMYQEIVLIRNQPSRVFRVIQSETNTVHQFCVKVANCQRTGALAPGYSVILSRKLKLAEGDLMMKFERYLQ
jgi:hypothetical protein